MAKKDASASTTSNVRYQKLKRTDDGFIDMQFQKPPPKIPWRAIMLALFLFILGTTIIIVSSLMLTGYITKKPTDGTWVLLILGILMFIPGFYHVRIAYYAYKLYPGYSFDDIPDFE